MLTASEIASCQQRFDLSYHVNYALDADQVVGLRGKDVLEVGGSLPDGFVRDVLGARRWIGIEEQTYWSEITASGGLHGTPPTAAIPRRIADALAVDFEQGYGVFSGRIEELPAALHGRFDIVFSIAAFEHIHKLATTLDGIHLALKPGGRLFTIFAPIWSSARGHHLPRVRDQQGKVFEFNSSPIPLWGHLLMRPEEMFRFLLDHTDRATAAEMVYYVYHSSHINRLFTEDYVAYCHASSLKVERCEAVFLAPPPPETQQRLEQLHPGRVHFANSGLRVVMRKD
jgi:hypothetical protein